MKRTLSEAQVLKKLEIPDFRHMTKDKAMSFATMLPQMDPEVAKKALEQFPEFVNTLLEISTNYKEIIEKSFEENSLSTRACYDTCNSIIKSLTNLLEKQELSYEERDSITNKMIELAKMVNEKDTENKNFFLKAISIVGVAAVAMVGVAASVLGSNSKIELPSEESVDYIDDNALES